MIISERQKRLLVRYEKVLLMDPAPACHEWPISGVGRSSFLRFCNTSHGLSRNTLNKLEKFILMREKEVGL